MKNRILLIIAMSMFAFAEDLPQKESFTKVKGKFEQITLTVLEVISIKEEGYDFKCFKVKYEGKEIWVSAMIPIEDVDVGDDISLMVLKNEMSTFNNGESKKVLSFNIMPGNSKSLNAEIEKNKTEFELEKKKIEESKKRLEDSRREFETQNKKIEENQRRIDELKRDINRNEAKGSDNDIPEVSPGATKSF